MDEALVIGALEAAEDASIAGAPLPKNELRRATDQQPGMPRRLVAIHHAYRRSQEQLRILDDAVADSSPDGGRLPWAEVRDWFHTQGNYIDPLDRQAEALAGTIMAGAADLAAALQDRHDVSVSTSDTGGVQLRRYDRVQRLLVIDRTLPPQTTAFLLA